MSKSSETNQVIIETLKEFAEQTRSSKDHLRAVALQEVIRNGEDANYSLRSVVAKSGYGFSTFYKWWKGFDEYLLDAYALGTASYLRAEQKHIDRFDGETVESYFRMIAVHAIAGNRAIPRGLFQSFYHSYLKGQISRMLDHVPKETEQIASGFERYFAADGWVIDRQKLAQVLSLHATYMLMRKIYDRLIQADADLVELMIDSALGTISTPGK